MALDKLMNKSFYTRAISGIVLVLVIALTAILGGDILYGFVFAISMIGLFEFYRLAGIHNTMLGYIGYLAAIIYMLCLRFIEGNQIQPIIAGFFIVIMAVYVFTFPKHSPEKVMMSLFGVVYIPVMMSYMYMVREYNSDGIYTFWLIFICSWICDTCAYFAGVICGKHKMTPILSPKKTIEGAIGGIAGAAIVGAVYGMVIENYLNSIDNAPILFAVIGAVGGLISMIGDLCASAFKRSYDIKDYGKLIPGHGGIMDRFDSVIITAPIIYYLIVYFGRF